jgi:hypothetical protein
MLGEKPLPMEWPTMLNLDENKVLHIQLPRSSHGNWNFFWDGHSVPKLREADRFFMDLSHEMKLDGVHVLNIFLDAQYLGIVRLEISNRTIINK